MARRKITLVLARRACRDLEEIHRYLAEKAPRHLTKVHAKFLEALGRLARFPESGHRVREFRSERYREIPVYHFRVIYKFDRERRRVSILTVRHGSRFLPTILEA